MIIVFAILISLFTSLQILLNLAQFRWMKGGFFERITVKFTMSRSWNQNKVMSAHVPKDIKNLFFSHIKYYLDETIHSLLSLTQTTLSVELG